MIEIKRRLPEEKTSLPLSIPPLLRRIYAQRGICHESELSREISSLQTYENLADIDQAVQLLAQALKTNKRIVVVGDFDVDGATSSALSVAALRALGCTNVDYLVPNRFEDGYGLSPEVVEQALLKGAEFIMTVDNGISSIDGVKAAKEKGLLVLITDHHLPGNQLPEADAIVNPNLVGCQFESKSLAGVGVAFYLMLALRAHLRKTNWFDEKGILVPNLAELLDLVALGTVADVVPLDKNNRILVHQGLMRIRKGKCRPGIRALIDISNKQIEQLSASDFGFSLGPRINAAGRLDDMSFGVELLLCQDLSEAHQMAAKLDDLNKTRRDIEQDMKEEALSLCEELQFGEDKKLPHGLALYQAKWHQGVIGILASRIKETYHRPVIAFADAGNGFIKGSARSIQGLHMRDLLDLIDTNYPGLIKKFGGHAMAAGLTIAETDFQRFADLFDEAVKNSFDEDALKGVLLSDGELAPQDINLNVAQMLRDAGPWGQGFPEPLFDGRFRLINQRLVGEKHLKMMLEPVAGGELVDAIAFNIDLACWPDFSVQEIDIAYRLEVNEFRGNRTVQLLIEDIRAL